MIVWFLSLLKNENDWLGIFLSTLLYYKNKSKTHINITYIKKLNKKYNFSESISKSNLSKKIIKLHPDNKWGEFN